MEQITEYFLSLLETVEKEGRLLKLAVSKTFLAIGFFAAGVMLLAVGLLVLAWTCFTALSGLIGPIGAGFAATAMLLAGGGILLWSGKKSLK